MTEIRTVTTLRYKRNEILGSIESLRAPGASRGRLAAHQRGDHDLCSSGDPKGFAAYVDIHHLCKRGEAVAICKGALADGPLDTRQLAVAVIRAKGMDPGEKGMYPGERC